MYSFRPRHNEASVCIRGTEYTDILLHFDYYLATRDEYLLACLVTRLHHRLPCRLPSILPMNPLSFRLLVTSSSKDHSEQGEGITRSVKVRHHCKARALINRVVHLSAAEIIGLSQSPNTVKLGCVRTHPVDMDIISREIRGLPRPYRKTTLLENPGFFHQL